MKVSFDADMNDMVDVTMRTIGKKNAKYYSDLAVIAVGSGGLFGLIGYFIFSQSWVAAVIGFAFGAIYTVAYNYNLRERRVRKFIQERQLIKGPALHVEVEISEAGLSFTQSGVTTIREWSTIKSISETDDAIYFGSSSDSFGAVRKRAFASDAEKDEFLNLSRGYMERASLPSPPTFPPIG